MMNPGFSGKIPVHNLREPATQAVVLIFSAIILINLHQALGLLIALQQFPHAVLISQNVMFHEPDPLVVRRWTFGLKQPPQGALQRDGFTGPGINETDGDADVNGDFPRPVGADKLLFLL